MSIHLNYYLLSPEGRKRFEQWRDDMGITEGVQFSILQYLYTKHAGTVAEISHGMKISPKQVIPEIEFLMTGGYLMVVKP